eukprot:2170695-Pleurochrysis_carterae.AAC.1
MRKTDIIPFAVAMSSITLPSPSDDAALLPAGGIEASAFAWPHYVETSTAAPPISCTLCRAQRGAGH